MTENPLRESAEPLINQHDVALLDLDGVVYVGSEAVPGVSGIIAAATDAGMRFGYVTNNAARSPAQVGDHLRELGIAATDEEVITSSQAASRVLAERLPEGSAVLIIGTSALAAEVERVGLRAVWSAVDEPAGVVQGYSPETSWVMLAEACVAIRAGALWVATNTDATLPSPRGPLPGNGSFVRVVRQTTGAVPLVAGKPEPAMHTECVLRTGAQRPLVVGDRLDTDIEGAGRVGVPSLLVLSGLATPADLLAADARQRPTYLAADLGGILVRQQGVVRSAHGARCGNWQVTHSSGELRLTSLRDDGQAIEPEFSAYSDADCDALRVLAVMAWQHGTTRTAAGDQAAVAQLTRLELPAGLTSRWPQGSHVEAQKGWFVVRDGFGTVAGIVKGAAQDALRGSRRALKATVTGIRRHAPDSLRLSGRKGRATLPASTPPRPAASPVRVPPSAGQPVPPAAESPIPRSKSEAAPTASAVAGAGSTTAAKKAAPLERTTAMKAAAKKTTAKKAAAKKTTAMKTNAKKATAKKAVAKKTTAKKTTAKTALAKKTTAKKTAAKKTAAKNTAAEKPAGTSADTEAATS